MKFEFLVGVEIKNDGITQDADPGLLASILQERVLENGTRELPWVLAQDISVITRDLR